jgi:hypothetical protein
MKIDNADNNIRVPFSCEINVTLGEYSIGYLCSILKYKLQMHQLFTKASIISQSKVQGLNFLVDCNKSLHSFMRLIHRSAYGKFFQTKIRNDFLAAA